jgi:signal transduction histidine kinase
MFRKRLLLGLSAFVLLLVGLGVVAMMLLSRMAEQVNSTITGNYRSILVAQAMRLDIDVLEQDAWAATTAGTNLNPTITGALERLNGNLDILTNAASSTVESALASKVQDELQSFKAALDGFRTEHDEKSRRDIYQLRMVPALMAADVSLEKIRDQNDQAILATPDGIQNITRNLTTLLAASLLLLLLVSIFVFIRIGRWILRPIESLTRATKALGEGNWNTPVPVTSKDELGELAQSFNVMARQLQEYRESTADEIVRLHRTMESTLRSFPDPLFVFSRCGAIPLRNPAAEEFSGKSGFKEKLPEALDAIVAKTLASGLDYLPNTFAEGMTFRLDEEEKFYLPRALAMRDKEDQLFGVALVLHDVTRFRLLDAAKTNLVATVSHELKTPLTGLRMALHLVTEKTVGELLPKQEELLQTAQDDAERLLRILNDLLDLARLDSGQTELKRTPVLPADLISPMVERFAARAAEAGVKITTNIPSDLPPVLVDEQRIQHVFANLISNAIKHSPRDAEILVSAEDAPNDCVEFAVTDQGPGVPEEYQKRIFDRFFRVPKQEKTGAGLGLSIAREIVIAHEGRIGVRCIGEKGSTFFVCLPAR